MEDRVEIAIDFSKLYVRRNIMHQEIEKIVSLDDSLENLFTFDMQSRAFYTFFSNLYFWYIGRENNQTATHFRLPFKGNPILAVTFDPKRAEEHTERLRESENFAEQFHEELYGEDGGKRWLPSESFAQEKIENARETFASSFEREFPFYLGHVLGQGCWAACKRDNKKYGKFVEEVFKEQSILNNFIQNKQKYLRAILERDSEAV